MKSPCVFCDIINGDKPAAILYRDEQVTAFKDIQPKTPVHILIVPNQHFTSINEAKEEDEQLIGHILLIACKLAEQEGIQTSGFRLIINTGPDAGQSVSHLHLHLLGGRHIPFRFD
jgi:histidine triad (HIT) family protein